MQVDDTMVRVIEFIITALMMIITRYLIPYLQTVVSEKADATTRKIIKESVTAMEVIFAAEGAGRIKKEEATKFVVNYLANRNIKINEEEVNVLIEAAVSAMKKEESK